MTEPAPTPRRGRPGYDQQTVLRRAVELFIRQGYEATSVGDLARELGLSKSAIYHHVDSKESLLAAALDTALDALTVALSDAVASTRLTAYARLRLAVRRSTQILVEQLPAVTLLLRVRGNSEVELAALARRRLLDDTLAGLVAEAVAEGALRDDIPPEIISRLLFGTVNSLVEWYRPGGPFDTELVAASIESMVFDGLGGAQSKRTSEGGTGGDQ